MLLTEENFDSLFAEKQEIQQVEISKIHPFVGHPFNVTDDEDMKKLTESIKENGIMTPLILRKDGAVYELVSGHRRYRAATNLNMSVVPAIVSNVSHDEAIIMMVDSNLNREHISLKEKAYAYKMKYDALLKQNSSCQVGTRTDEMLAENSEDSARQIQRYIRLTKLITHFINMIDEGKMPFTVGVELSYLDSPSQITLYEVMTELQVKISLNQAKQIHKDFTDGNLSKKSLEKMLKKEKAVKQPTLNLPLGQFDKFLNKFKSNDEKIDFLFKACELYEKQKGTTI